MEERTVEQVDVLIAETENNLRELRRQRMALIPQPEGGKVILAKALEFIEGNFTRDIRLPDVAKHVGVSNSAISRVINEGTSQNFRTILTAKRMAEALRLMSVNPKRSVKQIGFDVGFNDAHYFSRVFHEHQGLPATQYREIAVRQDQTV